MPQTKSDNRPIAERMYAEGETLRAISERIGVSPARVWQYIDSHSQAKHLKALHWEAKREQKLARHYRKCRRCGAGFYNFSGRKVFCSIRCRKLAAGVVISG